MQLHTRSGSADTTSESDEGRNPQHQFTLRSSMDLPRNVSLDCMVRYVDSLPAMGIDSYVSLDVRLGWRPLRNLELSIVGQDLISNRHAEFGPAFVSGQQAEVPRSVYGKIAWHF
jgi:iron complex outermembrane receptor protein